MEEGIERKREGEEGKKGRRKEKGERSGKGKGKITKRMIEII